MPRHYTPNGRFGQTSEPPVFNANGMGFPTRAQPEIASHSEGEFWDAVSASASIGKRHPVLDVDSGMCFPFRCPRETASRNSRSDRDNVSRWVGFRKACPALRAHSGMDFPYGGGFIWKLRPVLVTDSGIHFPVRPHRGNCVPFWGGRLGRAFPDRPMGKARPISALWPASRAFLGMLHKQKNRLEREFQPVIPSSKCRTNYDCAPSRKKRRLK